MDAKLQRRVQRYGWDRAAGPYDRRWAPLLRPAHEAVLAMAQPRTGEQALDVACGTGFLTRPLADAVGESGSVVATDISDEMVRITAEAARDAGLANVEARRMDAERLALPDAAFDICTCALGLMFAPEPEAALAEMYRVTRPGGRVAVAVWGERERCGWAAVFPIVDRYVASEVCPLFFRLGSGGTLSRTLTEVGFTDVREQRIPATLDVKDGRAALETFMDGGAVALAYTRFDAKTRAAVDREFLESLATYRSGNGYAIPAEFVVAGGRRPG